MRSEPLSHSWTEEFLSFFPFFFFFPPEKPIDPCINVQVSGLTRTHRFLRRRLSVCISLLVTKVVVRRRRRGFEREASQSSVGLLKGVGRKSNVYPTRVGVRCLCV